MTNLEVTWILNEIADLMEIKGENVYKIKAYRNSARALKGFKGDIVKLCCENRLKEIPGIGDSIAEKIKEVVETGDSLFLKDLHEKVPVGLREMMRIPGLGPKSVATIFKEYGITTLEELKEAAKNKQIRKLPRMGSKTELTILRGIDFIEKDFDKMTLGISQPAAQYFKDQLCNLSDVSNVDIAGSLRRGNEFVSNVNLVVAVSKPEKIIKIISKNPQVREVFSVEEDRICLSTWSGVKLIFHIVHTNDFYTALQYFTGSKKHNIKLQEHCKKNNLECNKLGLFKITQNKEEKIIIKSEKQVYEILGMQFIPPELREDNGEVELAINNELPVLVEKNSIKGDLHIHSNWSDGTNTLDEILEASLNRGYKYIAITDHSRSLKIANGLSIEKLLKQQELIKQLNKFQDKIKILGGSEVDILQNGNLDYPNDILKKLDIVIASIHSYMKQNYEKMTERVLNAIKNKYVDIIAHPTGRILGRREPLNINMEKLFLKAAETNTALEINASPERLDLNDEYAAMAKKLDIKIVINTDAHDVSRLSDIDYGIKVARRAGLKKENILNCYTADELIDWIQQRRNKG